MIPGTLLEAVAIVETKDDSYLTEQQRKFEEASETYRRETNEVFRELSRQLILVAAVVITLSSPIFGSKDTLADIGGTEKFILAGAWAFLTLSLLMGIIQFIIDYFYFRKWTEVKFAVAESIAEGEISTRKEIWDYAIAKQKNIPSESPTWPIWLQVVFLFVGLGLFLGLIITLLFE